MTAATTPKGERRRAALVAAAGELLVENGFDSVRHRAVALRAQIPLAATTYYFESLEDLLANAVDYADRRDIAAMSAQVAEISRRKRGAGALARLLAGVFAACETEEEKSALISRYERRVVSVRDPELMRSQTQFRRCLTELHQQILALSGRNATADGVHRLLGIIDGAVLAGFADPQFDVCRAVRESLHEVLDDLAPVVD